MRLPKEAFFAYRVMQNPKPDIHIIGHWTYPQGTKKTVYVFCNGDAVELSVNGKSLGRVDHPEDGYVFAFKDVAWTPGTIKAVGFERGQRVCEHELTTAGPPASVKLTPITRPGGLMADGADVALFDVEVTDAHGRRCPTEERRIDFTLAGPGIWRGGYNSGIVGSTNNTYLNTECGINRVAVRSTRTPGKITLTAASSGLTPATAVVSAAPVTVTDGLAPEGLEVQP